jgi:hypothetical protein
VLITSKLFLVLLMASLGSMAMVASNGYSADKLADHEVVLDKDGRLLPWTSFDNVVNWSMNYIKRCPTTPTKFGDDPWYLVTSRLTDKAEFMRNQNCQGSHGYWSVETLTRYYAYSGDAEAMKSVRLILDRLLYYHTPSDWAWPNVPRTQDNSPDGEYTDLMGEPDKMCGVGVAYIKFYKLTGEAKYLEAARGIAKTISSHVTSGDAKTSPLPFRINLKDGRVHDPYTSHMVAAAVLFDELARLGEAEKGVYQANRDLLWKWVLTYPVKNNDWTGYYEDVGSPVNTELWGKNYAPIGQNVKNKNQQSPMETARFMLRHPEMSPDYRQQVPALLAWVKETFGKTKRHGATSIREQDACNSEMGSHTSRYASIAAMWFAVSDDPKDREEARAAFSLATYSAYSKYSKDHNGVNYTGISVKYLHPWFVDSYFDYVTHFLEGMAELPEMAPADADHIIGSDSIVKKVTYRPGRIEYATFEPCGNEILRITFQPRSVLANGKELPPKDWMYGEYRGVSGVLRIHRESTGNIAILAADGEEGGGREK